MRLTVVIVLICFVFSTPLRAEGFDVAVAHIPPYAMKRDTGPEGILVDIVNEAFGRLGHHVTFHFLPWPRAINYVKVGKVDAIVPFFKADDREEYTDFHGGGLIDLDVQFFRKKGRNLAVSSMEEAQIYRIAQVAHVNLGERFKAFQNDNALQLDYVNNTLSGIKVLSNERVDLLVSVKLIAEYAAANAGLSDKIEPAGKPIEQVRAYLAFSKASKARNFGEAVIAEVEKMRKAGRLDMIERRYLIK